jgi:hypothetical protein
MLSIDYAYPNPTRDVSSVRPIVSYSYLATGRTCVLLRQNLPKGPILSTVLCRYHA